LENPELKSPKASMKKLIIIFAILASCNNPKEKNSELHQGDVQTVPTLDKTQRAVFAGVWVNKKYVENLRKTGSPKESQDAVTTSMVILPDSVGGRASIIWGFHEGTSGTLRENNGQLGIYTTEEGDADFVLSIEDDELEMRGDTFIKSAAQGNDDYPIAEEFLLSGKYVFGGTDVELTADGKIVGIDSLNRFSVALDYQDAGMEVDLITLGLNDQMKTYGFAFKGQELIIYHLNCVQKEDDFCLEVVKGDEYLALRRK
jgi:hypothetical protein